MHVMVTIHACWRTIMNITTVMTAPASTPRSSRRPSCRGGRCRRAASSVGPPGSWHPKDVTGARRPASCPRSRPPRRLVGRECRGRN
eukprot:scaffold3886_cov399-Prasinococcus_capsulatus_cf.AAC.32